VDLDHRCITKVSHVLNTKKTQKIRSLTKIHARIIITDAVNKWRLHSGAGGRGHRPLQIVTRPQKIKPVPQIVPRTQI